MSNTDSRKNHIYFAVCPSGAEAALGSELKRGRFGRSEAQVGGASFAGPAWEGWRATLTLRSAVRVYRELGRFKAGDEESLYRGAFALPWEELLTPATTFAVDTRVNNPAFRHSGFAALKIKDAIVDRMRERVGSRPSVDTTNPDYRLFAHIGTGRTVVSVDLGGRPLSKRGYRINAVEAPVSECLAAAAVEYSGWDEKAPFLDPMCGSGTIPIEAAMRAMNIAPGLVNPQYSFFGMPDFEKDRWEEMLAQAKAEVRPSGKLIIRGSDKDPAAIEAAMKNARLAGVGECVRFEVSDIEDFSPKPGWGAWVLSNPPYGKRLEADREISDFFRRLGQIFISRCKGYKINLFLPDSKAAKEMMLKPDRYRPLFHGGLEARLYTFTIKG